MSEEEQSPKDRSDRTPSEKPGSPKASKKPEVGVPNAEVKPGAKENSGPGSYRDDTPHSEIKEPATEKMEVHHHPQLEHKAKPWKEYLLEGFMIFVAVTMGFFAETIREGISDRSKGKEYIRSFVEDMRHDKAIFAALIAYDSSKLVMLNKLSACYDSVEKDKKLSGCLVPIIKSSMSNKNGNFTDGTMQQLKNAGGFRLLNESDKDSIVSYDHATRAYLNFESTIFQQRQDIVRDIFVKLIDFKAEPMLGPDSVSVKAPSPILFSNDKALVNEYFNDLLLYKRVIKAQAGTLGKLSNKATGLIKYFGSKYDLE